MPKHQIRWNSKALSDRKSIFARLVKRNINYAIRVEDELKAAGNRIELNPLLSAELMAIAVAIEPTDGIFCSGCVKMNQLTGEVLAAYPELPALQLSIFDTGGTVDTEHYHEH